MIQPHSPNGAGAPLLFGCLVLLAAGPASASAPVAVDLAAHERRVFSQFGEDGVIQRIFEIIAPTAKFVVEFGAHDGITNSNARNLIANHGWGALLIEGDDGRATKLRAAYADNPKVTTLQAWIYPGNIEILFEENGVPKDLDLLVIDIDSNDYYVWRAIHDFRPKVVMIEVNARFPPPELMVIDFHPMNCWDRTSYHGASLQSYYNLAKKKGYELIYMMRRGPNAFFVDKQYYPLFGLTDNTPAKLFHAPYYGLTGPKPLIPEGKEYLICDEFKIKKKFLHHR